MAKKKTGAAPEKFFAKKMENLGIRLTPDAIFALDPEIGEGQRRMYRGMSNRQRKLFAQEIWANIVNDAREKALSDVLRANIGQADIERMPSAYEREVVKTRSKIASLGDKGTPLYTKGRAVSSQVLGRIGNLKAGTIEKLAFMRLKDRLTDVETQRKLERILGPVEYEKVLDSIELERETEPSRRGRSQDIHMRGGTVGGTEVEGTSQRTAMTSQKMEARGPRQKSITRPVQRKVPGQPTVTGTVTTEMDVYDRLKVGEFDPKTGVTKTVEEVTNEKVKPLYTKTRTELIDGQGGRVLSAREVRNLGTEGQIRLSPQTEVIETGSGGDKKYTVLFRGFEDASSAITGQGTPPTIRTFFFRGATDPKQFGKNLIDDFPFAATPADNVNPRFLVNEPLTDAARSKVRDMVRGGSMFKVKQGTEVHTKILQSGMNLPTSGDLSFFIQNWDGEKAIDPNKPTGLFVVRQSSGTKPAIKPTEGKTKVTLRGAPDEGGLLPPATRTASGEVKPYGRATAVIADPTGVREPIRAATPQQLAPQMGQAGLLPPRPTERPVEGRGGARDPRLQGPGQAIRATQAPTTVFSQQQISRSEIQSIVNRALKVDPTTPLTGETFKKGLEAVRNEVSSSRGARGVADLGRLEGFAYGKTIEEIEGELLEEARGRRSPQAQRVSAQSAEAASREAARYKAEVAKLGSGELVARKKPATSAFFKGGRAAPALLLLSLLGAGLMGGERDAA
jgi:hypothetical protein